MKETDHLSTLPEMEEATAHVMAIYYYYYYYSLQSMTQNFYLESLWCRLSPFSALLDYLLILINLLSKFVINFLRIQTFVDLYSLYSIYLGIVLTQ